MQARKEQIYEMYVKGSREQEIAQAMSVNQSTVSRAVRSIKRGNLEWYEGNHDKEGYLGSLLKEHIERVRGLLREAWLLYYKVGEMDMGRKIQALTLIKNSDMSGPNARTETSQPTRIPEAEPHQRD